MVILDCSCSACKKKLMKELFKLTKNIFYFFVLQIELNYQKTRQIYYLNEIIIQKMYLINIAFGNKKVFAVV